MKKLFVLAILILLAYFSLKYFLTNPETKLEAPLSSVTIGTTRYDVEIVDDDNERAKGLSGRVQLPLSSGMLFLFPTEDFHTFWMRGMKIPLDFVWISGDRVVDLTENVPIPLTDTYAPPTIRPKEPVDKVLEINAGEIARNGIKIGDQVILSLLNPQSSP